MINSFITEVSFIQEPVHWFHLQINWMISIWYGPSSLKELNLTYAYLGSYQTPMMKVLGKIVRGFYRKRLLAEINFLKKIQSLMFDSILGTSQLGIVRIFCQLFHYYDKSLIQCIIYCFYFCMHMYLFIGKSSKMIKRYIFHWLHSLELTQSTQASMLCLWD